MWQKLNHTPIIQPYIGQKPYACIFPTSEMYQNCCVTIYAESQWEAEQVAFDAFPTEQKYVAEGTGDGLYRLRTMQVLHRQPGAPFTYHTQYHLLGVSLKQPWADLVMLGYKTLETRVWGTKYRGDLLICSSSSKESMFSIQHWDDVQNRYAAAGIHPDARGMALGIVHLDGIEKMKKEHEKAACIDLYPRAKIWKLSNVRHINPFPISGSLGVFVPEFRDKTGLKHLLVIKGQ